MSRLPHFFTRVTAGLTSLLPRRLEAESAAHFLLRLFVPLENATWQRFLAAAPFELFSDVKRPGNTLRTLLACLASCLIWHKAAEAPCAAPRPSRLAATASCLSHAFLSAGRRGFAALGRTAEKEDNSCDAAAPLRPSLKKGLAWAGIAAAAALGLLVMTQPFTLTEQVVFLTVMLAAALLLSQLKAKLPLMLLFVISIVVSGRYLWWRITSTISPVSTTEVILGVVLLTAELYAFAVMVLGYFPVCWVLDRKSAPLPADPSHWPSVDIFIPTYNESMDVIKPTVYAALNLDWPQDKLNVYLLDDGSRPEYEAFMKCLGAGYIKREEHNHAKAGNINHAMTVTRGDFIAIFDCDHVPSCDFLKETMGWFLKDERTALVQAPHHFYSADPFEKNLHLSRALPNENGLFHDFIQKGNDTWNAVMFCGSNAVIRRAALNEVGGIAVETVTEDAHTSLKLNRRGWNSVFTEKPLASGLATDTLAAHIGQRIRWARGMIQIFRLDNPLLGKGLTLPQRLCFFNAMLHFLHGLPRLIFLLAPLPYLFAGNYIIYAGAASIFAYVLPHMIHSAITNFELQKGHRIPFLGGVYETVLSWYILLPTTVALLFPHKGKFNVTAKGGTIGKKYLDWHIALPYLTLLALNVAGLAVGVARVVSQPQPEYLTLAINAGWIGYNLLILLTATAVAVEEVQTEAYPRVPLATSVTVRTEEDVFTAETRFFSQHELLLAPEAAAKLAPGTAVTVTLTTDDAYDAFTARAAGTTAEGFVILALELPTPEVEQRFNRFTFARRSHWSDRWPGDDNAGFLAGLRILVQSAGYGLASMIELLPPRLQWIHRSLAWIASFAPRFKSTSFATKHV